MYVSIKISEHRNTENAANTGPVFQFLVLRQLEQKKPAIFIYLVSFISHANSEQGEKSSPLNHEK